MAVSVYLLERGILAKGDTRGEGWEVWNSKLLNTYKYPAVKLSFTGAICLFASGTVFINILHTTPLHASRVS